MCISYGARPNFIDHPHPLDCLSIRRIISEDILIYLPILFAQCPNLSIIGVVAVTILESVLKGVNNGLISLPYWRIIKFEPFPYFLGNELADCLIQFKESIKPKDLQVFFEDQLIAFERFLSIIHLHGKFAVKPDEERTVWAYLDLYKEDKNLAGLSCLFWVVRELVIENESHVPDDDLVPEMKNMQNLQNLYIEPESPPIDERLFRMMLTTWTRLQFVHIANPVGQVGQRLLEQMPDYWPNMKKLTFGNIPEDLKFVAKFKNLMSLCLAFSLAREETMFFMQTCPSLHHIQFRNDEIKFYTFLRVKTFGERYCNVKEILRNRYSIDHRRPKQNSWSCYVREFDSLDQLVDHYYNFFNQ